MANAKRSAAQRANDKRLGAMAKARATKRRTATGSKASKPSHAKRSGSRAAAKPATSVVVVRQPAAAKPASRARAAVSKARASAGKMKLAMKPLINDVVIPVAIGGAAASVVDVAYGAVKQFLPAAVADHPVYKPLVKVAAGIGGAMALQHFKIIKPAHAKAAAIGIGTVQFHNAINGLVQANTSLQLNGVGVTLGEIAGVLPDDTNGLEALGMLASGDASLGAVLPYQITQEAA